jgi:hypothetical protein
MDFVLTLGTAATATALLVAIVKFAMPAASSAVIALSALLSGEGMSFLATAAQKPLDRQSVATAAIAGIFAAAGAIGIRAADNAADKQRDKVQP